jgi:hypothetical protein
MTDPFAEWVQMGESGVHPNDFTGKIIFSRPRLVWLSTFLRGLIRSSHLYVFKGNDRFVNKKNYLLHLMRNGYDKSIYAERIMAEILGNDT